MHANNTKQPSIIQWLLQGDPAIVYQTHRDLIGTEEAYLTQLRKNITEHGWGRRFLNARDDETGLWGGGIYTPKWISTTYTLLDLKNLGIHPRTKEYIQSSEILIMRLWKKPEKKGERYLDLCICGMLLNLCCYASIQSYKINEIIDYILEKYFHDGGWNCRWEFDSHHSSLHTTMNILDGLHEYFIHDYSYRKEELMSQINDAHEFILMHKLFKSDKTDRIINKKMTMLSYPYRWRHDILRCMDYFTAVNQKYDERMDEALDIIMKKRMKNGYWPVQQKYPGKVHFDMENTGKESRWNTLRVLRILKKYKNRNYEQICNEI